MWFLVNHLASQIYKEKGKVKSQKLKVNRKKLRDAKN